MKNSLVRHKYDFKSFQAEAAVQGHLGVHRIHHVKGCIGAVGGLLMQSSVPGHWDTADQVTIVNAALQAAQPSFLLF